MPRLSFEKQRVRQTAHATAVRVRVVDAGRAWVGGTAVLAAPGQEIQQSVLDHLQRLAISLGAPVQATVHDDRTGCVVPLEVAADGSSRMVGEAVRAAGTTGSAAAAPAASGAALGVPGAPGVTGMTGVPGGMVQAPSCAVFGPPPVMDVSGARPDPAPVAWPAAAGQDAPEAEVVLPPEPASPFEPAREPGHGPVREPGRRTAPQPQPSRAPAPLLETGLIDPDDTPTPPRGFDAVAEEVLGDEPVTETAEGAELLTAPMALINAAVREGRLETAADLAARTVTEASTVLGPCHPEVLHLRELTAYIAYLAGDPAGSFGLSMDLARLRRQARDAEAAYGNVRSAATAWRGVRDPEEGLRMGAELIALWTDLMAEPGPAAAEPEPLESAHSRMTRLTARAAAQR